MALPKLDLSLFTNGSSRERQQLASDLLDSFSQHGFVRLVNHGVPDKVVSKLFQWNRSFFRMQAEHKISIANQPGPDPQRGWSKVGAENSSTLYRKGLLKSEVPDDLRDAREHFDLGPKGDFQYPNRWPDETVLPGFRADMEDAFEMLELVSANIIEALEVAFKLPHGAFLDRITHHGNASEMRLNHYPAIDIKEIRHGGVGRIWPHFDLGVITLLFQDGVGGLEFENREHPGTFNRVECGATSDMIVNISETMQRWTNDCLRAGLHRVNVPEDMEYQETGTLPERYSIAYFCKADRRSSVGALKQFIRQGADPVYQDMLAIEYHQQRLQSAY